MTRANFYNLHVEGSSIESIHTAFIASRHILDDISLIRVWDIIKHPHKKEWAGLIEPTELLKRNSRSCFWITKKSHIRYQTIISTIHSIKE